MQGCLVEFKKDTKTGLALLQRPDGKRNWFAMDVRSVFSSLTRKLSLVILKQLRSYCIMIGSFVAWRRISDGRVLLAVQGEQLFAAATADHVCAAGCQFHGRGPACHPLTGGGRC